MNLEMIGPSRFAGAGRDALPRVRRCTSRRFFLLLLRTRSYAIGAEALSLSCFSICTFFGRAPPDRAGARPERVPPMGVVKRGLWAQRLFHFFNATESRYLR